MRSAHRIIKKLRFHEYILFLIKLHNGNYLLVITQKGEIIEKENLGYDEIEAQKDFRMAMIDFLRRHRKHPP